MDIGYANLSSSGTQETMANSGTAFALRGATVSYNRSTGHSDEEVPGKYTPTELNYASVSNPKFSIRGVLRSDVSNDVANAAILDAFCTTKGLKVLYYNSTTDGYQSLVSALGATTTSGTVTSTSLGIGATTKFVVIRCLDFEITQVSSSKVLEYRLTCEVTA